MDLRRVLVRWQELCHAHARFGNIQAWDRAQVKATPPMEPVLRPPKLVLVKDRYPTWNPGKWKQSLKPVVVSWWSRSPLRGLTIAFLVLEEFFCGEEANRHRLRRPSCLRKAVFLDPGQQLEQLHPLVRWLEATLKHLEPFDEAESKPGALRAPGFEEDLTAIGLDL